MVTCLGPSHLLHFGDTKTHAADASTAVRSAPSKFAEVFTTTVGNCSLPALGGVVVHAAKRTALGPD